MAPSRLEDRRDSGTARFGERSVFVGGFWRERRRTLAQPGFEDGSDSVRIQVGLVDLCQLEVHPRVEQRSQLSDLRRAPRNPATLLISSRSPSLSYHGTHL